MFKAGLHGAQPACRENENGIGLILTVIRQSICELHECCSSIRRIFLKLLCFGWECHFNKKLPKYEWRSKVQKLQKFRSILLVLFVAIGVALAGGMVVYLTVHAWQAGEFHSRGRIIRLSSNPIEFILVMALGGAFGVALLGSSPLIMLNALRSDAAKNKFIADNSKIYGGVRSSIIWLLISLLVLVGYALLLSLVDRL